MDCGGGRCPESARCNIDCTCARLAAHGITIVETDTGPDLHGWYDADARAVYLDAGAPFATKRSTLAHELVHVVAGDVLAGGLWLHVHEQRIEDRADDLAARDLIPLHRLIDVVADCPDLVSAAERLVVDVDTLRTRLARLTENEAWLLESATRPQVPEQRQAG